MSKIKKRKLFKVVLLSLYGLVALIFTLYTMISMNAQRNNVPVSMFGYDIMPVDKNIMQDVINKGDVVYVKKSGDEAYNIDDVIVYYDENDYNISRIIEVDAQNKIYTVRNETQNQTKKIVHSNVRGLITGKTPYFGNFINFLNSPPAIIIIIIFPITLILIWLVSDTIKKGIFKNEDNPVTGQKIEREENNMKEEKISLINYKQKTEQNFNAEKKDENVKAHNEPKVFGQYHNPLQDPFEQYSVQNVNFNSERPHGESHKEVKIEEQRNITVDAGNIQNQQSIDEAPENSSVDTNKVLLDSGVDLKKFNQDLNELLENIKHNFKEELGRTQANVDAAVSQDISSSRNGSLDIHAEKNRQKEPNYDLFDTQPIILDKGDKGEGSWSFPKPKAAESYSLSNLEQHGIKTKVTDDGLEVVMENLSSDSIMLKLNRDGSGINIITDSYQADIKIEPK